MQGKGEWESVLAARLLRVSELEREGVKSNSVERVSRDRFSGLEDEIYLLIG